MSEIATLIDEAVGKDLAKRLKADGYRKSGKTFYCVDDTRTAVVNVQASKWNLGDDGSFAINLGVYFPEVANITNALPFNGRFPKEYDCTVRQRLGVLMTGGNDYWWSVNSDVNLDTLASNVGYAWSQFGKPWIDRVSDLDAAHSELVNQHMYFVAAAVSVLRGRRDEAGKLIRKAEARQPRAAGRIREWARKHELV